MEYLSEKLIKFGNDDLVNHSSVGGIIFDNSRKNICLLFHKKMNKWTIPVGHIDKGYTPDETIDKELKEEIGIDVLKKRRIIFKRIKTQFNEKTIQIRFHLYMIDKYNGVPKNKEGWAHKKMKFFSITELKNMPREDLSEFTWLWLDSINLNEAL
jgi:mutator protein MutT